MDISKKNLYLALGSISLYYFLLHDISEPLGGLVFFFIGWALPLVFIVFLSLFLSSWQSEKFGLNKKIFFIGFILFAVIFSTFVDRNIYRLHTVGGDEGCMCMYFSYGRGRLGDEYQISRISNIKFFQYATESFFRGFQFFRFFS